MAGLVARSSCYKDVITKQEKRYGCYEIVSALMIILLFLLLLTIMLLARRLITTMNLWPYNLFSPPSVWNYIIVCFWFLCCLLNLNVFAFVPHLWYGYSNYFVDGNHCNGVSVLLFLWFVGWWVTTMWSQSMMVLMNSMWNSMGQKKVIYSFSSKQLISLNWKCMWMRTCSHALK